MDLFGAAKNFGWRNCSANGVILRGKGVLQGICSHTISARQCGADPLAWDAFTFKFAHQKTVSLNYIMTVPQRVQTTKWGAGVFIANWKQVEIKTSHQGNLVGGSAYNLKLQCPQELQEPPAQLPHPPLLLTPPATTRPPE